MTPLVPITMKLGCTSKFWKQWVYATGRQNACVWQTWQGCYLGVLMWSSLRLMFSGILQKDLFKGGEDIIVMLVTQSLLSSFLWNGETWYTENLNTHVSSFKLITVRFWFAKLSLSSVTILSIYGNKHVGVCPGTFDVTSENVNFVLSNCK